MIQNLLSQSWYILFSIHKFIILGNINATNDRNLLGCQKNHDIGGRNLDQKDKDVSSGDYNKYSYMSK